MRLSRTAVAATLLVAIPACVHHRIPAVPGAVVLSQPEVHTRERLVKERLRESQWLATQLDLADKIEPTFQGYSDTRDFFALMASGKAEFDPTKEELAELRGEADLARARTELLLARANEISTLRRFNKVYGAGEMLETAAATTGSTSTASTGTTGTTPAGGTGGGAAPAAGGTTPPPPPATGSSLSSLNSNITPDGVVKTKAKGNLLDLFHDKQAYRDAVNAALRRAELDDGHDLKGLALYDLGFDLTVLAGDGETQFVQVDLELVPGIQGVDRSSSTASRVDQLRGLFYDWVHALEDELVSDVLSEVRAIRGTKRLSDLPVEKAAQIRTIIELELPAFALDLERHSARFERLAKELKEELKRNPGKRDSIDVHLTSLFASTTTSHTNDVPVEGRLSSQSKARLEQIVRAIFDHGYAYPLLDELIDKDVTVECLTCSMRRLAQEMRAQTKGIRTSLWALGESLKGTRNGKPTRKKNASSQGQTRKANSDRGKKQSKKTLQEQQDSGDETGARRGPRNTRLMGLQAPTIPSPITPQESNKSQTVNPKPPVQEGAPGITSQAGNQKDKDCTPPADWIYEAPCFLESQGDVVLIALSQVLAWHAWADKAESLAKVVKITPPTFSNDGWLSGGLEVEAVADVDSNDGPLPGVRPAEPAPSSNGGTTRRPAPMPVVATGQPGVPALPSSTSIRSSGIARFVRQLLDAEARMYSLRVEPQELAQNISSVATRETALSLALSIVGTGVGPGASSNLDVETLAKSANRLHAIERQPLLIGFGQGDREFGWLAGPRFKIDGGVVSFSHTPVRHNCTAAIVVPAWLDSVRLRGSYKRVNDRGRRIGEPVPCFRGDDDTIDVFLPMPNDAAQAITRALVSHNLSVVSRTSVKSRLTPSIDFPTVANPATLRSGGPGELLILGPDLWRNPTVFVGQQPADVVRVLPDMRGLYVKFSKVAETLVPGGKPDKAGTFQDLVVVTSYGQYTSDKSVLVLPAVKKATASKPKTFKLSSNTLIRGKSKSLEITVDYPEKFHSLVLEVSDGITKRRESLTRKDWDTPAKKLTLKLDRLAPPTTSVTARLTVRLLLQASPKSKEEPMHSDPMVLAYFHREKESKLIRPSATVDFTKDLRLELKRECAAAFFVAYPGLQKVIADATAGKKPKVDVEVSDAVGVSAKFKANVIVQGNTGWSFVVPAADLNKQSGTFAVGSHKVFVVIGKTRIEAVN